MKMARPNIHRFQVGAVPHVFDVNTNRIFSLTCEEDLVLALMEKRQEPFQPDDTLKTALAEISKRKRQGLFSSATPEVLRLGADDDWVLEQLRHHRHQTIIELTQNCNLRCRYCSFSGGFEGHRCHNEKRMDWNILSAALDDAVTRGERNEEISISFYGGEPLLEFGLLQEAVRYLAQKREREKVRLSLTTNGTLINRDMARYLSAAGFSLLISVDGPLEIHDRYRKDRDGRGSFYRTTEGLRTLVESYSENGALRKLGLNMVVAPPYHPDALEQLRDELPWLPEQLRINVSYVDPPPGWPGPGAEARHRMESLRNRWERQLIRGEEPDPVMESLMGSKVAFFAQRQFHNAPRKAVQLNGCCIPGARKVLVTSGGDYRICERAHHTPDIGRVGEGLNEQFVLQLIKQYSTACREDCAVCWAVPICGLCFCHGFFKGRIDIPRKRRNCEGQRRTLEEMLKTYCRIIAENPKALDTWQEIDFS